MSGNIASTQGYEPDRPGLELVVAQRLTVLTAGGQQDPQGDVDATGRDGSGATKQALMNCERAEHLML
eukprot:12910462-Prorocentrum_lima.AAC.1